MKIEEKISIFDQLHYIKKLIIPAPKHYNYNYKCLNWGTNKYFKLHTLGSFELKLP